MTSKTRQKTHVLLVLIGGAIPLTFILSRYFGLQQKITVPLIVILSFIFGALALWVYANRQADGSEWWQDDHASGWRGY